MLKRIVWADDGSEESANALKVAEYFAGIYGSEILGVYINYVFYPITPNYSYYAGYIEEAAEKNKREFVSKFEKIKNKLGKKKITFKGDVIRGSISDSIVKMSDKKKADMITLGNTGKGFLTKILIGSNSLNILRKSKVPVLTVPRFVNAGEYKLNKILVPVDISENNFSSLNTAVELAKKTNSTITVLYVLSVTNNIMEYPQKVIEQIISGIENSLDEIVATAKERVNREILGLRETNKKFENNNLRIRKKQLVGMQPAVEITNYAKKNKFDLIVMNSHNKGNMERVFLGSVTEEVIRNSRCAVLSIKPK